MNIIKTTGIFCSTNRGFGYVEMPDYPGMDLFVSANNKNSAMNRDVVEVTFFIEPNFGSFADGKVVNIVKRYATKLVGTVDKNSKAVFIIPDDPKIREDIFIPKGKSLNAKKGEKVVVVIEKYPENNNSAEGRVIKVLNRDKTYSLDALSILEEFSLPYTTNDDVEKESLNIPLCIEGENLENRVDFRAQKVITIDGEDTKDVDDAVYVEKTDYGYDLYVHIADVAHYVKKGSAIDLEAKKRATSIYLISEVVPMLPKALSNGICSLNEGVDRLCMTCKMKIDNNGKVLSSEIIEGVVRVLHHTTYNQVQDILKGKENLKLEDVKEQIFLMQELSRKIDFLREKTGNIDFNTIESKYILNKKGNIIDVEPFVRLESHRIIENFMIYANESVATEYFWRSIPFIYRVHEEPQDEKLEILRKSLVNVGISLHVNNKIHSGQLKKVLDDNKGGPLASFLNDIILRAMMRAKYSTNPIGHFGLGLRYYSHFTSPIRRYADLEIHRIIKDMIHLNKIDQNEEYLSDLCEHISLVQKRVDDCQREYEKIKKIKFMTKRIEQPFVGRVTHLTKWGLYITLENTVEGMIRYALIDSDRFSYDEKTNTAIGSENGEVIKIGDELTVEVVEASLRKRTLDFYIV